MSVCNGPPPPKANFVKNRVDVMPFQADTACCISQREFKSSLATHSGGSPAVRARGTLRRQNPLRLPGLRGERLPGVGRIFFWTRCHSFWLRTLQSETAPGPYVPRSALTKDSQRTKMEIVLHVETGVADDHKGNTIRNSVLQRKVHYIDMLTFFIFAPS